MWKPSLRSSRFLSFPFQAKSEQAGEKAGAKKPASAWGEQKLGEKRGGGEATEGNFRPPHPLPLLASSLPHLSPSFCSPQALARIFAPAFSPACSLFACSKSQDASCASDWLIANYLDTVVIPNRSFFGGTSSMVGET